LTTKVSFYGGLDEIGGNKILLEDKGTRIFLDFGKSFAKRSKYYDFFTKPRLVNGIGDLLELGIIPDLKGIYRKDLLSLAGRTNNKEKRDEEDRSVDAVVLSHAHSDHADHISLLREDIPVYMGWITKTILESIEDERNSDIEFEITRFKKRPINSKDEPISREIRTFKTSDSFAIDSITVKPVHVDHSIPGCYGLIIDTSEGRIIYSGDLRTHGNKGNLTKDFVEEAAKERKPDLMLCEGTRINEAAYHTESDVYDSCKFLVSQTRSCLVFAEYSYKDIDRFTTFYKIAKETNRKLLIGIRAARYLQALKLADPSLGIPEIDDESIGIYRPRELKCAPDNKEFYEKHSNIWTFSDMKARESQLIVSMSSYSLDELIDIEPSKGLYIHSTSEPFNEEGEIDEQRTRRWLAKYGLESVHCHCSGHASGIELAKIVNTIDPKIVVPIHTEQHDLFPILFHQRVAIVKEGNHVNLKGS
jgi:ribonuclease J